jgi:hypothetical protein
MISKENTFLNWYDPTTKTLLLSSYPDTQATEIYATRISNPWFPSTGYKPKPWISPKTN